MTSEERSRQFRTLLSERFGVTDFPADQPPIVKLEQHHELARVLKEEFGYGIYINSIGSHWEEQQPRKEGEPGVPEHYEVATGLRTVGEGTHAALWRVEVPMDGAIPSLYDLFAGADWQEREQYDLVGVRYANHPDLRRIMMPEDWEGHPLRKNYAIETGCAPWR